ncbi:NADP-dependent malic enzyme [hydrothermal vent metagenome]|uniref:NADP-dependent malic enzyme n=1 Tax=hydrothermal vent metagenome TaxID=652676 RepID=A0A3B0V2W7_9ZZZZ
MSLREDIRKAALEYHNDFPPGKIKIVATKALTTAKDLALAYSPGVAAPCEAIAKDPATASLYTARGNMVAVITNGTAVLGLGDIGPLAAKPVMEGKAVLFKKFAGVDVFDIEIDEKDPDKLIDIIAALEPTFGGINLEDIKSPECFYVEEKLKNRLKIPVFHDDQHGTAIITCAAVINGLKIIGKDIGKIKLVTSGAGAAGMACLDLLVDLGLSIDNIIVSDSHGVLYEGREDLVNGESRKQLYAAGVVQQTLSEALVGADVFLGVSVAGVLKPEMIMPMAKDPIILALANPVPEIMPDVALLARADAIIATGRSDFPNQVNNVLCFPYIFRGTLDVGSPVINDEMKKACVYALAELAQKESSDVGAKAFEGEVKGFGREYLIPQPFDPRILLHVAPAVAQAAMDSGVATRPIENMQEYKDILSYFVFKSGLMMKPIFDKARNHPKTVVYAEGEDERVLRAVRTVIDDNLAKPILIGRPEVVAKRIAKIGIDLTIGKDFELVNPQNDPRFKEYWQLYHNIMQRHGISPEIAKAMVRTRTSVIAALMVKRGEADAMLAGLTGRFPKVLAHIMEVLGTCDDVTKPATMSGISTEYGNFFFCDTYVNPDPDAKEIAKTAILAAAKLKNFGKTPRLALLSYSSFGSRDGKSPRKMRKVLKILSQMAPELEIEGEMEADLALIPELREAVFPNSKLKHRANLFIMPNLDTANAVINMLKCFTKGVTIGPILLGSKHSAHVLIPTASVRRIINMTAIAVVDAQNKEQNVSKK